MRNSSVVGLSPLCSLGTVLMHHAIVPSHLPQCYFFCRNSLNDSFRTSNTWHSQIRSVCACQHYVHRPYTHTTPRLYPRAPKNSPFFSRASDPAALTVPLRLTPHTSLTEESGPTKSSCSPSKAHRHQKPHGSGGGRGLRWHRAAAGPRATRGPGRAVRNW